VPRIDAPTVAEHHTRQRRALLDAARDLLAETGQAPSMAAVGRRAGLARSSVYQYFSSPQELLLEVVAHVFPDWAAQVQGRVDEAESPGERVWAYVEANIALFASSERAVAEALARVVEPSALRGPMQAFHAQLQVPLRAALTDLGEPEVETMAETIDAIIVHASHRASADGDALGDRDSDEVARERTLAQLRRLIGGYLGVTSAAGRRPGGRGS
jgi:AcrR family transcriptional regulator